MTTAASNSSARAVFLDRDGVINENRADYVKSWDEFCFVPGALEALERLASTPLRIVVVTNQSAVGRKIITIETLEQIHEKMVDEIERAGGRIDAVFCCPHSPEENCACRKPKPGMLIKAARDLNIDLAGSCVIGDSVGDIRAARNAGCEVFLVRTGLGGKAIELLDRTEPPPREFSNLSQAVDWILSSKSFREQNEIRMYP